MTSCDARPAPQAKQPAIQAAPGQPLPQWKGHLPTPNQAHQWSACLDGRAVTPGPGACSQRGGVARALAIAGGGLCLVGCVSTLLRRIDICSSEDACCVSHLLWQPMCRSGCWSPPLRFSSALPSLTLPSLGSSVPLAPQQALL